MPEVMMIRSLLNEHVIDIENDSTTPGAALDAYTAKSGTVPVLNPDQPPPQIAANQSWEVLPDPAGSAHYIIKNPATGHCIDIQGDSQSPGAALDAYTVKSSNNQNQLWDLLPDPFGSGGFFIQNPQTGLVIGIENGSDTPGAALVINPRRMFDSDRQLWSGMLAGGAAAEDLPLLTIATPPTNPLVGHGQYVSAPADQTQNITSVTVTLNFTEDLVVGLTETLGSPPATAPAGFSVQINGNCPYRPQPGQSPFQWDVDWIQFGLVMTNNNLVLFNQVWNDPKPYKNPAFPGPSEDSYSSSMLGLKNNTIPGGTRIVLSLVIDSSKGSTNDFVTGITGKAFDGTGAQIGTTVTWSLIGRPTFAGPPVTESDLAPWGAFQVVIVGPPGGFTQFTSGAGTITIAATPEISAQLASPGAAAGLHLGTGEQSNMCYGLVQEGVQPLIAQPFGVPSPNLTPAGAVGSFSGTGLYPNATLTANVESQPPAAWDIELLSLTTAPDGSFSLIVTPENTSILYQAGAIVTATVTDAYGNWAKCKCLTAPWGKDATSTSGTSTTT